MDGGGSRVSILAYAASCHRSSMVPYVISYRSLATYRNILRHGGFEKIMKKNRRFYNINLMVDQKRGCELSLFLNKGDLRICPL